MKKSLLVFCLAAGIYACGGGTTEVETKPISNNEESKNGQIGGEAPKSEASATPAAAPVAEAAAPAPGKDGKALIAASDCLACHKEKEKMVGPAYADVAKKYENNAKNVKMLAEKIIAGGQGNWGEIPMAAHPNVSQEDAEAMVNYILSIK
jgi:cytochrome c